MELSELAAELDELRGEKAEEQDPLKLLQANVGEMASIALRIDGREDEVPDDRLAEIREELFAGVLLACMEYGADRDVNMAAAIEERIERMRTQHEQRKAVAEAIDDGDAAAVADAFENDASVEDDDADEPRYIG